MGKPTRKKKKKAAKLAEHLATQKRFEEQLKRIKSCHDAIVFRTPQRTLTSFDECESLRG